MPLRSSRNPRLTVRSRAHKHQVNPAVWGLRFRVHRRLLVPQPEIKDEVYSLQLRLRIPCIRCMERRFRWVVLQGPGLACTANSWIFAKPNDGVHQVISPAKGHTRPNPLQCMQPQMYIPEPKAPKPSQSSKPYIQYPGLPKP